MSDHDNTLGRIERRLRQEMYFGDDSIEMVMAVLEDELTGETDRAAIDWHHVNSHRIHKPGRDSRLVDGGSDDE